MNDNTNEQIEDVQTDSVEAVSQTQRGASLIEYALLIALIAVVCVAAVGALGSTTGVPYSDVTSGLR